MRPAPASSTNKKGTFPLAAQGQVLAKTNKGLAPKVKKTNPYFPNSGK